MILFDEIAFWHRETFPWAKLPHVMDKLEEERIEAVTAWSNGDTAAVADELADCLICILAAMAREQIDPDTALASKWARVQAKYDKPQRPPFEREATSDRPQ